MRAQDPDDDRDPDDEDDVEIEEDDDEREIADISDPEQTPWAVAGLDWTSRCHCEHPLRARTRAAAVEALHDHARYTQRPRIH